jgi:hypothetical protein
LRLFFDELHLMLTCSIMAAPDVVPRSQYTNTRALTQREADLARLGEAAVPQLAIDVSSQNLWTPLS